MDKRSAASSGGQAQRSPPAVAPESVDCTLDEEVIPALIMLPAVNRTESKFSALEGTPRRKPWTPVGVSAIRAAG